MSDTLDARARALLEAVVVGDRGVDDPEVDALARQSTAFRERLRELRAAAGLLERTAQDQRATRGEADRLTRAPGEAALGRVPAAVRAARAVRAGVWLALAAAGVALIFWLARRSGVGERAEPILLGPEIVRLLAPRGAVDAYAPIAWEGHPSPRGEYRITILDATGATPSAEPLLQHRTADTRWTPSPEELERLPARIRIEVAAYADGVLLGSDSAQAWR